MSSTKHDSAWSIVSSLSAASNLQVICSNAWSTSWTCFGLKLRLVKHWGHQVQHVRSDGSPEQHVAGSGGLEVRRKILPLKTWPLNVAWKDVCFPMWFGPPMVRSNKPPMCGFRFLKNRDFNGHTSIECLVKFQDSISRLVAARRGPFGDAKVGMDELAGFLLIRRTAWSYWRRSVKPVRWNYIWWLTEVSSRFVVAFRCIDEHVQSRICQGTFCCRC